MTAEQREQYQRPAFLIHRGNGPGVIFLEEQNVGVCYTLADAVSFIQMRPDRWHNINQNFELPYLKAKLLGNDWDESVRLEIPSKSVVLPRSMGDSPGVSLQTHTYYKYHYKDVVNLIFQVDEDDRDIDRGVVWLGVGEHPAINYHLRPGERNAEEIKEVMDRVSNHVTTTVMDYMDGYYPI